MSVNLYDDAIINSLREITQDSRIHISPAENVFRTIGKLEGSEDNINLPIISLSRPGWTILDSNHHMKFDGAIHLSDHDNNKVQNIQAIPIRINYLLDVWTRYRAENDMIMRELIFYYKTHPTLSITVPYGLDYVHNFNIFFESDIEDNSDIVEHKNRGEYFRQTIGLYTDDAYLWKSSSRGFTKLVLDYEAYNNRDNLIEVIEKGVTYGG